jgi:hypothetical protein
MARVELVHICTPKKLEHCLGCGLVRLLVTGGHSVVAMSPRLNIPGGCSPGDFTGKAELEFVPGERGFDGGMNPNELRLTFGRMGAGDNEKYNNVGVEWHELGNGIKCGPDCVGPVTGELRLGRDFAGKSIILFAS